MRQRQTVDDDPWYLWPRLWTEQDLALGANITLPPDQSHYLKNVLRMREGEKIRLFHADKGEWDGQVTTLGKKDVTVVLSAQRRLPTQSGRTLGLLFAMIKKEALDTVLVKATELGVTHLQPILTERTVVRGFNLPRAQILVREAAEQCERLTVPQIAEPVSLKQAISIWASKAQLIAAIEADTQAMLLHQYARTVAEENVALVVGPEGGFTTAEQDWLRVQGKMQTVSLGPRIVKAETASLLGLGLLGPNGGI